MQLLATVVNRKASKCTLPASDSAVADLRLGQAAYAVRLCQAGRRR